MTIRTVVGLLLAVFLDGRDANSYANVAWIFGLHDRPFGERPIYGKVRSMTASGLQRKSDIDVIYIHGFGFPAWRGGPMFHADQVGLPKILADVQEFHRRFGERWTPSELLIRLVAEGKNFASLQGR